MDLFIYAHKRNSSCCQVHYEQMDGQSAKQSMLVQSSYATKNKSLKDDESSDEDSEYYENDKKFLLNRINRNDDKPRRRKKEPEVKEKKKVKDNDDATGRVLLLNMKDYI